MSFVFLVDEDMLHNQIIDSELTGGNLTSIDSLVNLDEQQSKLSSLLYMGSKPKLSLSNNGNYSLK